MTFMFHEILYRPFFNALFVIYNWIAFQDIGIAIIFLTVLVRLLLYPIFHHSMRTQTVIQKIQPRIKEIQNNHKDDREKQTKALMDLYKQHKVNPFSGFFLLLVQLPVFIALYYLFSQPFDKESFSALYSFVQMPDIVNKTFLGLINLHQPSKILVVSAAVLQYIQSRYALPKIEAKRELSPAESVSRQMIYLGPVLTLIILWRFPAAIALYWATTSAFSIIQQFAVNKKLKNSYNQI